MNGLWRTFIRAGELGRIGWTVGRLKRATDEATRLRAREALARHLGAAGGLPMKVGQLLAGFDENEPLHSLVSGTRARPWRLLAPHMERALGRPVEEVFAEIDPEGIAASVGQVHRGVLVGGRQVALKVRLPGIRQAIEAELQLAGLVSGVGPSSRKGMDVESYKRFLRDMLFSELDYRGEAERQTRMRAALAMPGLVVPEVEMSWTSETLLVQRWEPGDAFISAKRWPRRERLELGRVLLETLLRGALVAGEIHADPHPGNLRVRRGAEGRSEVVLYDFGCTLVLTPVQRRAFLSLIVAARDRNAQAVRGCLEDCGFDALKLSDLDAKLPGFAWILLEPFMSDRAFDVAEWRVGERTAEQLGELRWWFRSAAPPQLLLLMRAFQGLVRQLVELEATLPWWPILERVVGADALAEARCGTRLMEPAPLPTLRSSLLRVRIDEEGRQLLTLALPAHEVFDLARVLSDSARRRLSNERFDFDALNERLRATSAAPQNIFRLDDGKRSYRVWLE